jgi:CRP-like cAMP-binding protein
MDRNTFEELEFFRGLSPQQLELLRAVFVSCEYPINKKLFAQGDAAEYLFIVTMGEVVVNFKPDDAPPLTVARVHPGEIVGWSAALGSKSYTSTAIALTDAQLLRVRGEDLRQLCEQYPETGDVILDRLANIIAERLRNTHPQVRAMLQTGLLAGVQV